MIGTRVAFSISLYSEICLEIASILSINFIKLHSRHSFSKSRRKKETKTKYRRERIDEKEMRRENKCSFYLFRFDSAHRDQPKQIIILKMTENLHNEKHVVMLCSFISFWIFIYLTAFNIRDSPVGCMISLLLVTFE